MPTERVLAVLAVVVLAAALAVAGGGLPLELPLVLLLLAAVPAKLRGPVRAVVTGLLAALLVLALLDDTTGVSLGRRFNLVLDLPLVVAGWHLAAGILGVPAALAAAVAAAMALAAAAAALWWATGGVPALPRPALFALAVPAVALVALDPPASRLGWEHLRDGWHARGDLARFREAAGTDRWAEAPPDAILPALQGRDVFLVFGESYGRAALDNPLYAPTTIAALDEAETRLAATGLAARSAWMTSPIVGGQSWLARASLVSGLSIDNEGRYRALLASDRHTLLHLARGAGWRTVVVAPAITMPWPEADFFGYDRVLAAKDLGYRGRPFNWVTMPDQFTLAAFERAELDVVGRRPVFAEIALISSHAPWTPVPPLLPWDALGDGRVFDAAAVAGDPPEVVWRDPDRVRDQYRRALDYALRAVAAFAERRAATAPLVVVLGDHQPAAMVSGEVGGRDVPVHVIGPPDLVARLDDWTPGLRPAADAPAQPMEAFRDAFLAGFANPPAAITGEVARPLPPTSRR